MAANIYTAREQARWMKPNASLWVRPDAARFYKPGTRMENAFPALALKYSPNQPRVRSGNPDSGQWTDGEGAAGRLAQPMGNIGITDRRVISDADPEGIKPGQQYAQARGGGRGRGGGFPSDMTPAEAARVNVARSRFEESVSRIRQIDPNWKPSPSLYSTREGYVRSYEADARQAEARERELVDRQLLYDPTANGYIVVNRSGRLSASQQREVNANGREYGCSDCGTFEPGTKSGNFIGDHRPPSALLDRYLSQRIFPHCVSCSARQGPAVQKFMNERSD